MADMSDAPTCPSCLHPHHPDVRCHICGHKGKGNSFRLPKFLGASAELHFEAFDVSAMEVAWSSHMSRFAALSALARIVRRDVFCAECHVPEPVEHDELDGHASTRHLLGFLGDAPVSYVRWRVSSTTAALGAAGAAGAIGAASSGSGASVGVAAGEQGVALLDRFCVRAAYRRRGIARAALQASLADMSEASARCGLPLAGAVAHVPVAAAEARQAQLLAVGGDGGAGQQQVQGGGGGGGWYGFRPAAVEGGAPAAFEAHGGRPHVAYAAPLLPNAGNEPTGV